MRAFDVLTKAEADIRGSVQPRYHLEMALLRWIHLRKLVPLTDLIEQMKARVGPRPHAGPATAQARAARPGAVRRRAAPRSPPSRGRRPPPCGRRGRPSSGATTARAGPSNGDGGRAVQRGAPPAI